MDVWSLDMATSVNIGKTFDEDAKDLDLTIYRLGLVVNGGDGPV